MGRSLPGSLILITQRQVQWALRGMNYLPAPWSLFIRETGPDWGVTSTYWTLNGALNEPKVGRVGEMEKVVGGYGIQAVLSLDLHRAVSAKVTWIWISAQISFFSYPSKSGHRQRFPSPASPSPVRPSSFQAL